MDIKTNEEDRGLELNDIYSHPQLQNTFFLQPGKYISIFLIILAAGYLLFLGPASMYYTVMAISYLLNLSFLLALFCFARYLGNFKLKAVQRWLYLIIILFALTLVAYALGAFRYISGTFAELSHLEAYDMSYLPEIIMAFSMLVCILGVFFTCFTSFLVAGIKLIKFKGDFIGGLKSVGILLLVYPVVVIINYILSLFVDYNNDFYTAYYRSIVISVSCTLGVTGYLIFRVFSRASRYMNEENRS